MYTCWPLSEKPIGVTIGELPWQRQYCKWDEWSEVEPHHCHFCGEYVIHGYERNGKRHYLSDCRPDLVKHEIGELCTWPYEDDCYAYQNPETKTQTEDHIYFKEDRPM